MKKNPAKTFVATKGFIVKDHKLLLLKKISQQPFWDLPGGRLQRGENFSLGLKRELEEELPGLEIKQIGKLLGTSKHFINQEQDELLLLYFLVKADFPQGIKLSQEHNDFCWASLQDLENQDLEKLKLPVDPFLKEMLLYIEQDANYGVEVFE